MLIGDWVRTEDELALATTFTEKKIKYYNREDMTHMVDLMARWHLLLGVTTDSTQTELVFICQFIYDNFGNLVLTDLKMAMNWTIAGKLDVGFTSQKSLSAFYVSKALNAYMERKAQIINEIGANKEKYLREIERNTKISITPVERANIFKDFLISVYESYIEREVFWDINEDIYTWLKATGQINPTKEEINEALVYGGERLRKEKSDATFDKVIKGAVDHTANQDPEAKRKKYARQYIVGKLFKETELHVLISRINLDYFKNK